MGVVAAMVRNFRKPQVAAPFEFRKARIIVVPRGDALGSQALRGVELGGEKRRENLGGNKTVAVVHPCVLVDFSLDELYAVGSLFANETRPVAKFGVVDKQRAALAADDVFGAVKTYRAEVSDSSERPALVGGKNPCAASSTTFIEYFFATARISSISQPTPA